MSEFLWVRRGGCALAIGALMGTMTGGVVAHEGEHELDVDSGPNTGNVSLSLGVDMASAYYFRGIPQQDQGLIYQPTAEFGFNLFSAEPENEGFIKGIDLTLGTWNSLHSEDAGTWYESDFYTGVSVGLPLGITAGIGYTNLYGPAGGGQFSEEINISASIDDSGLFAGIFGEDSMFAGFGFNPGVNLVIETEAGSDGTASNPGQMIEFSVEPGITLGNGPYALSLSFPAVLGINISDYYETDSGNDDDESMGYFDFAIAAGIPLAFVPEDFGSWEATAALHFLYLGQSAREIGENDFGVSSGDAWETWVAAGVSMSY
jgi:hypothetical protein